VRAAAPGCRRVSPWGGGAAAGTVWDVLRPCALVPPERLTVRPIRASDKDALLDLFERMSDRSRRRRFLSPKRSLSARELAYFTEIDHRRHEALVAVAPGGCFAGVARYATAPGDDDEADVAFAVADEWQGRGIGTDLARRLVERARANGMVRLQATTLAENRTAQRLLRGLGFTVYGADSSGVDLELSLIAAAPRLAA
jgi:RimJ/RimL family protein N-acetyltransferase